MKVLALHFEDLEFERLKENKKGLSWNEFVLTLAKKSKGNKEAKK